MSLIGRLRGRRARWVLLVVLVPIAYRILRAYAEASHSLETVLGLAPGSVAWHACVSVAVLVLRFAAYGVLGGTLLAWPLEEWLIRRRRAGEAPAAPPDRAAAPPAR